MTYFRSTSIAAKASIGGTAKTLRARVFLFILSKGSYGATLNEIEDALKLPGNTVRPRRLELEERKLVEDSKLRRSTPSGRDAIVWIVPNHVAAKARARLKPTT